MKFRTRFNYAQHDGLKFEKPTRTLSEFAEECDINSIMSQYATGDMPMAAVYNGVGPTYVDCTDIGDYQSALNAVIAAQSAFGELPAKIRERFANDPSRLISFLQDEENRDEAVRLGLVAPTNNDVTPQGSPVTDTASNTPAT